MLAGWIADAVIGDPVWLPHPIVLFGKVIGRMERWLNKGSLRMLKGALMTVFLIAAVFAAFFYLFKWVDSINVFLGMAVKAISLVSPSTLMQAVSSSGFSKFTLPAMKPFFIISIE